MKVQKEEGMLEILVVVQLEGWTDTSLLVLVQKIQRRVLYLVGVQLAQQGEHL